LAGTPLPREDRMNKGGVAECESFLYFAGKGTIVDRLTLGGANWPRRRATPYDDLQFRRTLADIDKDSAAFRSGPQRQHSPHGRRRRREQPGAQLRDRARPP